MPCANRGKLATLVSRACNQLSSNRSLFREKHSFLSTQQASFSSSSTTQTNAENKKKKPFDTVLIANRGEIVQRVIRTCRDLGINTVAVYSSADAQAPFVQQADRAVCLGPAKASLSYLNTSAIFRAIQETGANAVHPGYGFLSENANFARDIAQVAGAVWLGPPPEAIQKMGDKLASKQIALNAGVTIVPGHDRPLESLEQARQMCNDGTVPYPVLLKAAAGGGGKGMRVCYNDRDLKEGWTLSKAESLQFFSDDRLLLEKYIERPHHIEFQVMATPTADGKTDVVVFPERECSIQRRNQKVIEESPSVLLKEETRRKMSEQVVKLCQAVGYQSAGTIEFLVDENQNFYFLEMNTRLQVEHPVTEAVIGHQVDLVKAMLWIGAGWGFPEEIQNLREGHLIRATQHAMEARIYAEDPLRGFLPSTGPLTPYVEPRTAHNKLRVDSGVVAGHVVTPHYDPMLSKVIASGKDRAETIQRMCQAMDEYVIEGVRHNARLVQAVLRHESFRAGHTPTSFLPTHFPTGFHGVELTKPEQEEFVVASVLIDAARRASLQQPPLTGSDNTNALVVRMGGFFGQPYLVTLEKDGTVATLQKLPKQGTKEQEGDGSATTSPEETKKRVIQVNEKVKLEPERYLAQVTLDGVPRSIQVVSEDPTGLLKVQMYGSDIIVLVQSLREYELSQHMHEPEKVDTSSFVLSPMPGTLISFAVTAGDEVVDGQELCVVEAMKMQNIIRSPKVGIIKSINGKVGDSLMADQVILEFQK